MYIDNNRCEWQDKQSRLNISQRLVHSLTTWSVSKVVGRHLCKKCSNVGNCMSNAGNRKLYSQIHNHSSYLICSKWVLHNSRSLQILLFDGLKRGKGRYRLGRRPSPASATFRAYIPISSEQWSISLLHILLDSQHISTTILFIAHLAI